MDEVPIWDESDRCCPAEDTPINLVMQPNSEIRIKQGTDGYQLQRLVILELTLQLLYYSTDQ